MELNGFKHWDKVIGYTPTLTHRGEEIQKWLDDNPECNCYVVLEDEPQDVCGDKCDIISKLFVVEVNSHIGLTHEDVQAAYTTLTACEEQKGRK
jgi:hypothetical protein